MGEDVSEVVPQVFDIRKQGKGVPPVHQESTSQSSSHHLVLSSLSCFLEVVVEGQDVDSHPFEVVDFEGRLDHEITKFGLFHGEEEAQVPVRTYFH